jgi:DNA-binding transcriptional ArsR family regulator
MPLKFNVKELSSDEYPLDEKNIDPYAKKLFSQVFTGMQGRYTRLKIIKALVDDPSNVNQLSQRLDYDYKSIQRNIKILEENQIIEKTGGGYGDLYFVSDLLMKNLGALNVVLNKVDKKLNKKKTYI